MKLLGWMHRKFRQNNSEEHKELSIQQPSVDDMQYLPNPSYCRRSITRGHRESQLRRSFAGIETAIAEEKHLEEESADQNSELFHGFLAIGTFGNDELIANGPSTPIFSISAETIAEKKTEATENELKLINDELEKVLGAESNDDGWNLSSGRNSHVSTGRSSYGSSITLSGKPRESADSIRSGTFMPLQEFLLGSAVDFPETTVPKKDHRVSLGELFQKTKEENSGMNFEKRADKPAVKLIKKMLKGKVPHSSSKSSAVNTGGTIIDAITSSDKKMQKILQMFHRKVHPEDSLAGHKFYKTPSEMKHSKQASNKGGRLSNGDIIMFPNGGFLDESTLHFNSQHNEPQCTLTSADLSSCKKECWIKTDSEYLVLEL